MPTYVTYSFSGTKVKLFADANSIDLTSLVGSLGSNYLQFLNGVGGPIWNIGTAYVNNSDGVTVVNAVFLQTLSTSPTNISYSLFTVGPTTVASEGATGGLNFAGNYFCFIGNLTGGGMPIQIAPGNFVDNGNIPVLPIQNIGTPGGTFIGAVSAGCYVRQGIIYNVMGVDVNGSGDALLASGTTGFIAQLANPPEAGTAWQNCWTDGTYNYLLGGDTGAISRYYIAKTDGQGNEIERNFIYLSDPNYDVYLVAPTAATFYCCDKGFMLTIQPAAPNLTKREILLLQPDLRTFSLYQCEALDGNVGAILNLFDGSLTGNYVFGSEFSTAYIDKNDIVYYAAYDQNVQTTYKIYYAATPHTTIAPTSAQPLGACWPCAITARGTQ